MTEDFYKGIEVRNTLFGEERTKQAFASDDPLQSEFQTLITAYCFGSLWGKGGVVWRDGSLMTICVGAAPLRRVRDASASRRPQWLRQGADHRGGAAPDRLLRRADRGRGVSDRSARLPGRPSLER